MSEGDRPGDLSRRGERREPTLGDRHHHGIQSFGRPMADLPPLALGDDLLAAIGVFPVPGTYRFKDPVSGDQARIIIIDQH